MQKFIIGENVTVSGLAGKIKSVIDENNYLVDLDGVHIIVNVENIISDEIIPSEFVGENYD